MNVPKPDPIVEARRHFLLNRGNPFQPTFAEAFEGGFHGGVAHERTRRNPRGAPPPTVVCLCGSTRFYDAFVRANYEETMAGRIVLSVGFVPEGEHGESVGCTPAQKVELDALHKRKIELADEILVLNVGDYIGESTWAEICHAAKLDRGIRFLQPHRRHICRPSAPWDPAMSCGAVHPLAREVGEQRDNYPCGDLQDYECPVCGYRWTEELPQ